MQKVDSMVSSRLSESQSDAVSFRPYQIKMAKAKTLEPPPAIDPATQLRTLKEQKREKKGRLLVLEEEIAIKEKQFQVADQELFEKTNALLVEFKQEEELLKTQLTRIETQIRGYEKQLKSEKLERPSERPSRSNSASGQEREQSQGIDAKRPSRIGTQFLSPFDQSGQQLLNSP